MEIKEYSYGIVPLSLTEGEWKVLLIQHSRAKHWGFPKGHAEEGETPQEAAVRELFEETHLNIIRFLSQKSLEEHYRYTSRHGLMSKTVTFFVAEVGGTLKLQEEEVSAAQWFSASEALLKLTYEADQSICRAAFYFVA